MTKQHFQMIADVLQTVRAKFDERCDKQSAEFFVAEVALEFADRLAAVNPRFDRVRFLDACGVRRS